MVQEITGWIVAEFLEDKSRCDSNSANYYTKWGFYTENLRTAKQEFVINNVSKGIKSSSSFHLFGFRYVKVEGLTQEEAALH